MLMVALHPRSHAPFMEKKPTEVEKAAQVSRRGDVIPGLCHPVSNSLIGCLNWPMLCKLWTEV